MPGSLVLLCLQILTLASMWQCFLLLVLRSLAKPVPSTHLAPALSLWPHILLPEQVSQAGFITAYPKISSEEDHTHFSINQRLFLGVREKSLHDHPFPWFEAEAAAAAAGRWASKLNLHSQFLLISPRGKRNGKGSMEEAELTSLLHLEHKPKNLFRIVF